MSTEREGTEQALEKMLVGWAKQATADQYKNIMHVYGFAAELFDGNLACAASHAAVLPMHLVEAILKCDE